MKTCKSCGKQNPADIHTCTPKTWEEEFDEKFMRVGTDILLNSADDRIGSIMAKDIKSFISDLLAKKCKPTTTQISMLRQWLNEKPADRLVTNEDILHWLTPSNE
jgi:hypothetical protein